MLGALDEKKCGRMILKLNSAGANVERPIGDPFCEAGSLYSLLRTGRVWSDSPAQARAEPASDATA
jgi:hypothetical protein